MPKGIVGDQALLHRSLSWISTVFMGIFTVSLWTKDSFGPIEQKLLSGCSSVLGFTWLRPLPMKDMWTVSLSDKQ